MKLDHKDLIIKTLLQIISENMIDVLYESEYIKSKMNKINCSLELNQKAFEYLKQFGIKEKR